MSSPPEPTGNLGLYTYDRTLIAMTPEEICINLGKAVSSSKASIPLFSIDPCAEDIYDLKNQYFSPRDIWGEKLLLETEEQRRTSLEKCKFSNLPPDFKRIIYYKRLNQMEETLYKNYFSIDNPATLFIFTEQEIRGIRPFMRVNLNIN
ncbi:MAG: hypothetical protein IBJ00_03470 [Alphaproteobacteria bacterium]|nr:hypothetical protein [Alphaproteobacteria bacterium]